MTELCIRHNSHSGFKFVIEGMNLEYIISDTKGVFGKMSQTIEQTEDSLILDLFEYAVWRAPQAALVVVAAAATIVARVGSAKVQIAF